MAIDRCLNSVGDKAVGDMKPYSEMDLFEQADALESELPPMGSPTPLPQALYHYTDAGGLYGILTKKALWATDYRFLNDTAEVALGDNVVQRTALALYQEASGAERTLLERFTGGPEWDELGPEGYRHHGLAKTGSVYVASLSEEGNQLSQWRAYAAAGGGYSIGLKRLPRPESLPIDRSGFREIPVLVGVPCIYDEEEFSGMVRVVLSSVASLYRKKLDEGRIKEKWLRISCMYIAAQRVGMLVPRLKHKAFSEEREWRIIVAANSRRAGVTLQHRVSRLGLIPYVEVPLTDAADDLLPIERVLVGPTQDPNRGCEVMRTFLGGLGYKDPALVAASTIPYRSP